MGYYAAGGAISMGPSHTPGGVVAGSGAKALRPQLAPPSDNGRSYRRTNPLNPKALRRAMRRVSSFAKFARKTMTFTQRHKMKRHRRR